MFLILSSFQVDAKEEILETVSKLVRHQADGVPHIQVDQLEGGGGDDDDDDEDQHPHAQVDQLEGGSGDDDDDKDQHPHTQVDQLVGGGCEHFPCFSLTRVLEAWSLMRPQPSPQ